MNVSPNNHELLNVLLFKFDNNGTATLINIPPPSINGVNYKYLSYNGKYNFSQSGDFDGDGNTDYILFTSDHMNYANPEAFISFPSRNPPVYNKHISMSGWINHYNGTNGASFTLNVHRLYTMDFDGDGKSEIFSQNVINSFIFSVDENMGFKPIYDNAYPAWNHIIYFGDFNGDKKTDLLTKYIDPQNSTNISWQHSLSTGNANQGLKN